MKRIHFIVSLAVGLSAPAVWADSPQDSVISSVRFDQKLDAQVPLNATFRDEAGRTVTLAKYMQGKPAILNLVYYECPMLCTEALNGLVRTLRDVKLSAGKDFNIITISFNPKEGPDLAGAKKDKIIERYGRAGADAGWAFLTGKDPAIRSVADSIGFHYAWDESIQQYAHATGVVVLTPSGKASRYLYGVEYAPRDLRLALVEAANGKIGTPVDRLLLTCYRYDPMSGKYSVQIFRILRIGAVLTVLGLIGGIGFALRRERRVEAKA